MSKEFAIPVTLYFYSGAGEFPIAWPGELSLWCPFVMRHQETIVADLDLRS